MSRFSCLRRAAKCKPQSWKWRAPAARASAVPHAPRRQRAGSVRHGRAPVRPPRRRSGRAAHSLWNIIWAAPRSVSRLTRARRRACCASTCAWQAVSAPDMCAVSPPGHVTQWACWTSAGGERPGQAHGAHPGHSTQHASWTCACTAWTIVHTSILSNCIVSILITCRPCELLHFVRSSIDKIQCIAYKVEVTCKGGLHAGRVGDCPALWLKAGTYVHTSVSFSGGCPPFGGISSNSAKKEPFFGGSQRKRAGPTPIFDRLKIMGAGRRPHTVGVQKACWPVQAATSSDSN